MAARDIGEAELTAQGNYGGVSKQVGATPQTDWPGYITPGLPVLAFNRRLPEVRRPEAGMTGAPRNPSSCRQCKDNERTMHPAGG